MQRASLILVVVVATVALSEGQFYVPRAYYTIDETGHESIPVPLQRLRRSYGSSYPGYSGWNPGSSASASANANANAQAGGWGDSTANANAQANAQAGSGGGWDSGRGWGLAPGRYGSSNPALSAGQSVRQAGPILGARGVTASSSIGLDSSGRGYYDQNTSVNN